MTLITEEQRDEMIDEMARRRRRKLESKVDVVAAIRECACAACQAQADAIEQANGI